MKIANSSPPGGRGCRLAKAVPQDDGSVDQGAVSHLVTERVVDAFQAVEVYEGDGEWLPASISLRHAVLGESKKSFAVVEPREIVR